MGGKQLESLMKVSDVNTMDGNELEEDVQVKHVTVIGRCISA
jgi:hypothetical protein